jgi:hypothetical protein
VRRLFFALLFANLAYFAWGLWVTPPPSLPVNEAVAHLPPLKLLTELPADQRPDPDAPPKNLEPVVTQTCMSVGPFPDVTNSAQAAAILKQRGFDPKQRAAEGDTIQGFGVFIGGMKSEAETDKVLVTLEHNGVRDALVMPVSAEGGHRVSLGLFTERARAERRGDAVRAMGLKPEIVERKIPGTLYWVDLAPQPGMTSVPLQDLFAEGVSSKVSVQPCPETPASASAAATPGAAPAPAARVTNSAAAAPAVAAPSPAPKSP